VWEDAWQYVFTALGSIGGSGLIFAAFEVIPRLTRASAAVLHTAAIYWAGMVTLWLFNDRYYLILLPAGALLLELARLPEKRSLRISAFAMMIAMGFISLTGTYSYQRVLSAVMAARDRLELCGIKRSDIDAGYELNGADLYRFPVPGEETLADEADIPMVTSSKVEEYTIAARPFPGTEIVGKIFSPGPFGLWSREMDVVRRVDHDSVASPANSCFGIRTNDGGSF